MPDHLERMLPRAGQHVRHGETTGMQPKNTAVMKTATLHSKTVMPALESVGHEPKPDWMSAPCHSETGPELGLIQSVDSDCIVRCCRAFVRALCP